MSHRRPEQVPAGLDSVLRSALRLAVDSVEPAADGLDRIKAKISARQGAGQPRWRLAALGGYLISLRYVLGPAAQWLRQAGSSVSTRFRREPGRNDLLGWLRPAAALATGLFVVASASWAIAALPSAVFSQSGNSRTVQNNSGGGGGGGGSSSSSRPGGGTSTYGTGQGGSSATGPGSSSPTCSSSPSGHSSSSPASPSGSPTPTPSSSSTSPSSSPSPSPSPSGSQSTSVSPSASPSTAGPTQSPAASTSAAQSPAAGPQARTSTAAKRTSGSSHASPTPTRPSSGTCQ